MRNLFIITVSMIFLFGCSSIKSVKEPNSSNNDGLTYFLPKKDFLATVKIKKESNDLVIDKVTLGTTPSYPDLSTQYILKHGTNLLGKNTLDVGVNEKGLLSSSKSTTTSSISDAFKNLVSTIGTLKPFSFGILAKPVPQEKICQTEGDHTFVFKYPDKNFALCRGITITIEKMPVKDSVLPTSKNSGTEYSGIFYRQEEPYLVKATGGGINVETILFSPSDSKTHFLPISRTLFSNNEADFAFSDGVPNKFKQVTDGELVALFKLPADIIGAYFAAVGSIFNSFKTTDLSESQALTESLKLELNKKKITDCIEAIKAKDEDLIKKLNCSSID